MVKKKSTKAKTSKNKSNGVPVSAMVGPPVIPAGAGPSFRDIKYEMESEIREFKDYLVGKYSDFHGHDLRRDASWYMEQMGIGIHSDIEREKRLAREKLIAENRAKEAAEAQATKK